MSHPPLSPFTGETARIISQSAKQLAGKPAGAKALLSIRADGAQGMGVPLEAI